MSEANDWKNSLNLPQTAFPMKANLPDSEPKRLSAWKARNLYARVREARKGKPRWILHDGPPYANGHIHLGHIVNKTLKAVSYTHLRAHETPEHLVCRLLLEKKKK